MLNFRNDASTLNNIMKLLICMFRRILNVYAIESFRH